ncbi:MAG: hypothetical protein HC807_05670, partial [Gammaproteobacteria bacterium]|nr:hypothetical protein [Gammaproteobacteria bacterium]
TGGKAGEVVPLSRIRKQIGAHMVRSKATSPHVLQAVEVDFHAVDAARGARGKAWRDREGFGLTYLPFIARARLTRSSSFPASTPRLMATISSCTRWSISASRWISGSRD